MQFVDKFDGIAFMRITSAYPVGALQKLQDSGICIYDVSAPDAFTICFSARRKDIPMITRICEKRGDRVDIEGWTGCIFYILRIIRRPVFLIGLLLWLIIALWIPKRILFVTVSGAEQLSDAYVLEAAADCGIHMGASAKDVRSEEIKNALLSKIPNLQWAGVNTSGCIATICIREKRIEDTSPPRIAIADILSTQDAIVRDMTVHAGTALCKPGQAVKKGQALISCYRDNGQILEFTGASGEVYGETKRQLLAMTPLKVLKRTRILNETTNFYVVIGKKSIKFQKDSGILDDSCVKMYEVKECILPGGFALPIFFVKEYVYQYALEPVTLEDKDCSWLNTYVDSYLINNLVAGSIVSKAANEEITDELFYVHSSYDCREMIANYECKEKAEYNGENN